MARAYDSNNPTVTSLAAELVRQNYAPNALIYSHDKYGKVEVTLINIQGGCPMEREGGFYAGLPMVKFRATAKDATEFTSHMTLADALRQLGIPTS